MNVLISCVQSTNMLCVKPEADLKRRAPVFDLQDVLLVDSVYICNRTVFEGGVELYGHAETAEDHVSIAVLAPKCLVGDFKTWGAVNCPVNPGHL